MSLAEQAEGYGLDAQEMAVREECARRGWVLTDVVRDEGSGKDTNRPGLTRVLETIASGQAEGLIVAKLDRLSRSVVDFGHLLDWLKGAGAVLVALDYGLDTTTPNGKMMANILMSVAEWERETIGQRTREGMAAAKAKGHAVSGPSVADRPELVERITTMRGQGMTLRAIAEQLDLEGAPTLRGAARWSASAVQTATGYKRPRAAKRPAVLPELKRRSR